MLPYPFRTLFTSACLALMSGVSVAGPANNGMASLAAQTSTAIAATGRAASVPVDFVVTPAGYFHPACVFHVRDGNARSRASAKISAITAAADSLPPCRYPHYTAGGTRIDTPWSAPWHPRREAASARPQHAAAAAATQYTGWIEAVHGIVPIEHSIAYLRARWMVPQRPRAKGTAVTFLFPGAVTTLQTADELTITQPVLGWNSWARHPFWSIASWNCCVDGNVLHGDYADVDAGDLIEGEMIGSQCSAATGICERWQIITRDLTTGAEVTLATEAFGQAFNDLFAGALEVYYVDGCDDLPVDGFTVFFDFEARDLAGNPVQPDFGTTYYNSDHGYAGDATQPPFTCNVYTTELVPGFAWQFNYGVLRYQ